MNGLCVCVYLYYHKQKKSLNKNLKLHVKDEKSIPKILTLTKLIDKYDISYIPPNNMKEM